MRVRVKLVRMIVEEVEVEIEGGPRFPSVTEARRAALGVVKDEDWKRTNIEASVQSVERIGE